MNTLRVRVALLLVAIILVVESAIVASALLIWRPPGPPHSIEPIARTASLLAALARGAPRDLPGVTWTAGPSPGQPEPELTGWLRDTLREMGSDLAVTVTRPPPPGANVVSIPVDGRGWLAMPMPDLPPPGGVFRPLLQFLFLITGTALSAALLATYRITRPLALLEDAVAKVGPSGALPEIPERGPAEVRATASALNRLSSRLKAAVESRMRLVAAAGHDLRTPMTRMRLRAEFLPHEERGRWLADIEELDRIADSAIALVREEVAPGAAETVRLDALARDVVDELAAQGVAVEAGALAPATACVGQLALRRALRNLAINAATHGGGARVGVSVSGGDASITVDDDGPGIAQEQLARALEPFFRADAARGQAVPGAGLGLSIAKEIVARAGGVLTLSNRAPHGLRAEIRLPIAA